MNIRGSSSIERSWVDVVLNRAETYGNKTAFDFLRDGKPGASSVQTSYASLVSRAKAIGCALVEQGVAGSRIPVIYPAGLEFIESFPDRDELIFTDHSMGPIEFTGESGDRKTAEVKVTYSAYHTFSLVVFDVTKIQEWYRDGIGNNWLVRPHFEGLEKFASAK